MIGWGGKIVLKKKGTPEIFFVLWTVGRTINRVENCTLRHTMGEQKGGFLQNHLTKAKKDTLEGSG